LKRPTDIQDDTQAQKNAHVVEASMKHRHLLVVILALSALLACGGEPPGSVRVAFGTSLAPYVMEQPPGGIELDIIRLALHKVGLILEPRFYPQARVPVVLAAGDVDAAATITPETGVRAAYSEPYIAYEDVAVTLRDRHLPIRRLEDLSGLRVMAFINATHYLGNAFRQATRRAARYQETGKQIDQNRLLYAGDVDVVIADRHIFAYLDKQLAESKFPQHPKPVDIHPILTRINYQLGFHDPALRDRFNQGLAKISPAERDAIFAAYAYQAH
jgi:polar amino acid transport system substrate-binding protein